MSFHSIIFMSVYNFRLFDELSLIYLFGFRVHSIKADGSLLMSRLCTSLPQSLFVNHRISFFRQLLSIIVIIINIIIIIL